MKPVKAWGMFVKDTDKLAAVWWNVSKKEAEEAGAGESMNYNSEDLIARRVVITTERK